MFIPNNKKKIQLALLTGVSAFAFLVGGISIGSHSLLDLGTHTAIAQGGGNGGGGNGGGGNGGGGEGAGGGHGGNAESAGSGGAKGAGADGEGGKGGPDKPWAGLDPALADIGRMNIIKAPASVLNRSIENMEYDPATQDALYSLSADEFAQYLRDNGLDSLIDSPVTNIALLTEYWSIDPAPDSFTVETKDENGVVTPVTFNPDSYVDFSGILIGTAVDKATPITTEMVEALLTIKDEELPAGVTAEDIKDAATEVQDAIVDVHG